MSDVQKLAVAVNVGTQSNDWPCRAARFRGVSRAAYTCNVRAGVALSTVTTRPFSTCGAIMPQAGAAFILSPSRRKPRRRLAFGIASNGKGAPCRAG
ncbi:MAG: hypothetical protein IJQ00_08620 [Kiritimatiellae bacterium]|nr:hypothetical protein [Kiritimatiellia bacterium]